MKDKHDLTLISEAYASIIDNKASNMPKGLQSILNMYIAQFPQYEVVLNAIKEEALAASGNIEAHAANIEDANEEEQAKQLAYWLES